MKLHFPGGSRPITLRQALTLRSLGAASVGWKAATLREGWYLANGSSVAREGFHRLTLLSDWRYTRREFPGGIIRPGVRIHPRVHFANGRVYSAGCVSAEAWGAFIKGIDDSRPANFENVCLGSMPVVGSPEREHISALYKDPALGWGESNQSLSATLPPPPARPPLSRRPESPHSLYSPEPPGDPSLARGGKYLCLSDWFKIICDRAIR